MWEEFKAIEPRVIRPVNGNEFFTTTCILNVADVFPKFSTEEFKKRAQENLSKVEVFNHAIKRINGHPFWIRRPFEVYVEEVPYTEDEEIENFLKKENQWITPYQPVFVEEKKDVQLLFTFKICQLEKSQQTKLTFSAGHAVCDGRSFFNMFELVRRVIRGETLEADNEALSSFDERERYQNIDDSFNTPPKVWNEISDLQLLPKIDTMPCQYRTIHHIYDYAPIAAFCKDNGVTVQAMLMAMISRAIRRYNHLPKETPIWNGTPCDTRASPLATEEFKKHQYYCNVSGIYPKVIGQATLLEDLKHCAQQLKEALATNDDVRQLYCLGYMIDPKTLQFIPKGKYPSIHTQATVNATNIGRVTGNTPLFYLSDTVIMPGMYSFFYHAYHTSDKLFIAGIRPVEMDMALVNCVEEEMDKIFIPENISKN